MTYCCISQGSSHGSEESKLLSCIWSYMISFEFPVIMDRSHKFYSTFQCELWSQGGNCVEGIFQLYLHRTTLFSNYLVCASKEDIVYICIRVFLQQYGSIWLFWNIIQTQSEHHLLQQCLQLSHGQLSLFQMHQPLMNFASSWPLQQTAKQIWLDLLEHVRYMCCIFFCW